MARILPSSVRKIKSSSSTRAIGRFGGIWAWGCVIFHRLACLVAFGLGDALFSTDWSVWWQIVCQNGPFSTVGSVWWNSDLGCAVFPQMGPFGGGVLLCSYSFFCFWSMAQTSKFPNEILAVCLFLRWISKKVIGIEKLSQYDLAYKYKNVYLFLLLCIISLVFSL